MNPSAGTKVNGCLCYHYTALGKSYSLLVPAGLKLHFIAVTLGYIITFFTLTPLCKPH